GLLPAVGTGEIGGLARLGAVRGPEPGRTPAPCLVPRPRPLDLHHLGAEIGEQLACPGPREDPGEVQDTNVGERAASHPATIPDAPRMIRRRRAGRTWAGPPPRRRSRSRSRRLARADRSACDPRPRTAESGRGHRRSGRAVFATGGRVAP